MTFSYFLAVVNRMFKGSKLKLAFEVVLLGAGVMMAILGRSLQPITGAGLNMASAITFCGVVGAGFTLIRLAVEFFSVAEALDKELQSEAAEPLADALPWYQQPRPNVGLLGLNLAFGCGFLAFVLPWGWANSIEPAAVQFKIWVMTAHANPALKDDATRLIAFVAQQIRVIGISVFWLVLVYIAIRSLFRVVLALKQASKSGFLSRG